jgi:organic radical activating enzyme
MNYPDFFELKAQGWLSVDFYLTKSCNKDCHYCTAWTKEMRNLDVDMDFLRHTLESFRGNKLLVQLLGGEPGLVNNLDEVIAEIKKYPEYRVSILSNSLIRKRYPHILEDPSIYYQEHLIRDFHKDGMETLGLKKYKFFDENNLNNYNVVIKTPGFFEYFESRPKELAKLNHKNTTLKVYNSRSPSYQVIEQAPLLTRKICSKFPSVPVVDFEMQKIRHCSKKVINGSRTFEINYENCQKMMNFELFEFESYCDTCTEQLKGHMGRTQEQVLKIMETL